MKGFSAEELNLIENRLNTDTSWDGILATGVKVSSLDSIPGVYLYPAKIEVFLLDPAIRRLVFYYNKPKTGVPKEGKLRVYLNYNENFRWMLMFTTDRVYLKRTSDDYTMDISIRGYPAFKELLEYCHLCKEFFKEMEDFYCFFIKDKETLLNKEAIIDKCLNDLKEFYIKKTTKEKTNE